MAAATPQIIRCPPQRIAETLAHILSELPPSRRREVAGALLNVEDPAELSNEPLFVAMRGEQMCGAAWGQRQPGNIAVFWPAWLASGERIETALLLAEHVVQTLDETSIEMTQVLVSPGDADVTCVLEHVEFRHLADLLYLSCEAAKFPQTRPPLELDFITYDGAQRARLNALIERTYDGTLDCTALNGVREVENVVTGYQATGLFRPENWMIARAAGVDVGILLLADHPKAHHFELMYMGLVPEARGRNWGRQIVQHAQWLARRAEVERIVLAVDSVNAPALRMYRSTGFEMWDRRAVYMRFPAKLRA
jgi:ribosomal protein S18 acetylase RimI-like enzyme